MQYNHRNSRNKCKQSIVFSNIPFFGRRQTFLCLIYLSYSRANILHNPNNHEQCTVHHRWELPILHYHIIGVNHPYPFLGVIFRVILHNFIRHNYHNKQSNCYPFPLIMVNYPIFSFITTFMFSENCTKLSLSQKNTRTIYQKRVTFCNFWNRSSHRNDCF